MTREEAFRTAFRLASRCASVGGAGFQCQDKTHHRGLHSYEVNGVRYSWGVR